ncbi:2-phospho-L-lactate transferase [Roseomonas sp. BN140053]|uniref:2-phospho-L-lactate transferase n=1 Tax=Roseomonas sp. BN140053 TaxID=3391898 RepID=UPI0039ED66C6
MTRILALSGGIGGAKLALGLQHVLAPGELTVVANVGDDFEHLGLSISPDTDTLLYTLAGIENPTTGWGRRDETWTFMKVLRELGAPDWFQLGDGDLALHVERTRRLRAGETLSAITADVAARLGLATRILPASDDPVRTRVRTEEGWLDFQDWFVGRRCAPLVQALDFVGIGAARPLPAVLEALANPALEAVVICPSNPFISVEPILGIPGLRDAIRAARAPVIAVSPIIGGQAVKGPTAKMMAELGLEVDAAAVAARYADLLDLFVLDEVDAALAPRLGLRSIAAPTWMRSLEDRIALARTVLAAAEGLRP